MTNHPLHRAIGKIITQDRFPRCEILKDRACSPGQRHRISLFYGAGPNRVRFCDVDLLIALKERGTVIIEIEESNVKPVQIFGKFFASAFSTHHGKKPIVQPLLFIQVVDTSALKLEKTKKGNQWGSIAATIKRHAGNWPRRAVRYELFEGGPGEFKPDLETAIQLIQTIRDFLVASG